MKYQIFTPTEVKIAVIGGGTGSFTLLSALKNHTSQIAALVNMVDDGGSTGVLRDELGVLPPGDVRQCLVALSRTPEVRDLFNYRFDSGSMEGHSFGNIFLSALEKMNGDFAGGVKVASRVLNIVGTVEPITLTNTALAAEFGGKVIHGQYNIEMSDFKGEKPKLWLEPRAEVNLRALAAIEQADVVVIAPGSLYYSLAPALIVPGVGEALAKTQALIIQVCNLNNKPGHTDGFQVVDYATEIERFIGQPVIDYVLYNTEKPSRELLKKYAKEGELPVDYKIKDLERQHYRAVGKNLLSSQIWQSSAKSDSMAAQRTLIRHDSEMVAQAILDIYKNWLVSKTNTQK
ncbi:MAG: gluconeogenesis factor YvcK family protein [Candidatus Nanosyncoccaceae bacterium]|jgi:uncharacterized cofD-like protein